jgi:hypothetical protein
MEPDFDFDTMTNIGASYGLTCTQLGKVLKKHGLRSNESPSQPTPRAFDVGMVRQRFNPDGHYFWIWHVAKTCKLLEHLGHQRKSNSASM